jgi:voltage-gated potassium channel
MRRLLRLLVACHHRPGTRAYRFTQIGVWLLIAASTLTLAVELALPSLPASVHVAFERFDRLVLIGFSTELVSKILTYRPPELELLAGSRAWRLRRHVLGRIRYLFTPLVALDLLTVLAFMPALRGLRALRLLRLVAGVRFFKYSNPVLGALRAFAESWLLYASTLGFLTMVVVIGGVSLYLLEAGQNPAMDAPADGIWWALVTITTVGFGDITPATSGGRFVAGAVMVGGMFTLALFAGIVSTTFLGVVVRLRSEQFRMSSHAHHLVVCGYEPAARQLLDVLLAELEGPSLDRELILFGTGGRPGDLPAEFTWVDGDPTRESQLPKIQPEKADAIIVVGRRSRPPAEADAVTILTVFTLRHYMAKLARPRKRGLHVIAEVLDTENVEHVRAAGANEVIETTRLGFAMMAHSVTARGSGEIMSRVASNSAASVYLGRVPLEHPRPFAEVARQVGAAHGITVLGVTDPATGSIDLSPRADYLVQPAHHLIYLATEPRLELP